MVTHKITTSPGGHTVCGRNFYISRKVRRDAAASSWRRVTCKRCLAVREAGEADRASHGDTVVPPTT